LDFLGSIKTICSSFPREAEAEAEAEAEEK